MSELPGLDEAMSKVNDGLEEAKAILGVALSEIMNDYSDIITFGRVGGGWDSVFHEAFETGSCEFGDLCVNELSQEENGCFGEVVFDGKSCVNDDCPVRNRCRLLINSRYKEFGVRMLDFINTCDGVDNSICIDVLNGPDMDWIFQALQPEVEQHD